MLCFNHLLEAHAHMSSFMANLSSLAKIADPKTFDMVMKAVARPMIQVNVPECYLSPVQDPPPKTTAEEHLSQLEKVLLPQPSSLTQEPWYRPTRFLAAVVWLHLKHKFFNGGTTKEPCTTDLDFITASDLLVFPHRNPVNPLCPYQQIHDEVLSMMPLSDTPSASDPTLIDSTSQNKQFV